MPKRHELSLRTRRVLRIRVEVLLEHAVVPSFGWLRGFNFQTMNLSTLNCNVLYTLYTIIILVIRTLAIGLVKSARPSCIFGYVSFRMSKFWVRSDGGWLCAQDSTQTRQLHCNPFKLPCSNLNLNMQDVNKSHTMSCRCIRHTRSLGVDLDELLHMLQTFGVLVLGGFVPLAP